MAKIPKKILILLHQAREYATLKDASFDWSDSTMTARCRSGNFEGRPDTFIKERVRLHHDSYIIHPLDKVIAWAEGKESSTCIKPVGGSDA